MNLQDYVGESLEQENRVLKNPKLRFFAPKNADEIVALYDTYDGSTSKMHPLKKQTVNEYLDRGFAFAGAYYDQKLVGIAVSKQFPENYPFFAVPRNEAKGDVYTLGGLYVHPNFQGIGLASKLSHIIVQGTENFGQETGKAVGIGYEVSYDNEKSLRTLSKYGHYIGYYHDSQGQEGLSVLLYRPFHKPVTKLHHLQIDLPSNENVALKNLDDGLIYMGQQPNVGGVTQKQRVLNDGNVVTTKIINSTVDTMTNPVFNFNFQKEKQNEM